MNRPEGAGKPSDIRLGLDSPPQPEFYGSTISSDCGLLLLRKLDEVPGLYYIAGSY